MTKCVNLDFQNLTKNVLDQKWSNLCVPISVTTLLRFAMKNDLAFVDFTHYYTFDKILTNLTMRIYPRSLAGLNLNPKKVESQFQTNDIETLLERICKKTYLRKSGWEIVREQSSFPKPAESTCEYKKVTLNQNYVFSRPLTVTGAYLFSTGEIVFHQMTLDRIENNTFILQSTDFNHSPVSVFIYFSYLFKIFKKPKKEIRIGLTNPYYAPFYSRYFKMLCDSLNQTGRNFYDDGTIQMQLVSEIANNMHYDLWYLLPDAYSLQLKKIKIL
ncbi:unnamed protein product [Oikopleura dioica]|uniref:Uncharacterized protein n=1 Tax=Oikopleura dioica TaxID=34765 RepID=E4Z5U0_OIKDI|nr:unnamed protein product [Oikopleura dioica]